jgi:Rrf2 family cysteine metabolism transcriptional repressor
MKISTKGRYGTRVLLELANHWGKGPIQLKEVANNQQISLYYIEHLISPLVTAGLVKTARGSSGGVWLAKHPASIKVSEVIDLFEGSTAPVECVDNPGVCTRSGTCIARDIWTDVKKAVDGVLDSITFQDLLEKQRRKTQSGSHMYQI